MQARKLLAAFSLRRLYGIVTSLANRRLRTRLFAVCAFCVTYVVVYIHVNDVRFKEETASFGDEETTFDLVTRNNLCPKTPPSRVGNFAIDLQVSDINQVSRRYLPFRPGGHFKPKGCVSRTKTAVIVPCRDREQHLMVLLNHLVPFLVRQQAEFNIFVVEQKSGEKFNKAYLMNVGFVEALKRNNFTCIIFHDVDMLPETDNNLYRCGSTPKHMAPSNSNFGYRLPITETFGGVVAMKPEIFKKVNGFSNLYFGWGGEDDDMYHRLLSMNYVVTRHPMDVGVYFALSHSPDTGNADNNARYILLSTSESRLHEDGLSSLKYKISSTQKKEVYTRIIVDIDIDYYTSQISSLTEGPNCSLLCRLKKMYLTKIAPWR